MSHKYKHWGLLALRLTTGIVFLVHGWGKLTDNPGIAGMTAMLAKMSFPLPNFFAWIVALTEFVGGIFLIAGAFIQYTTILLGIVMLVALIMVKKFQLPAADPDVALLGSLIALYTLGPGKYIVGKKPMSHDNGESCQNCNCHVEASPDSETAEHDHSPDHHEHDHSHSHDSHQ